LIGTHIYTKVSVTQVVFLLDGSFVGLMVSNLEPRASIMCTSRKRCKKEPQLFFHCDSFDHPDLQSLNNCIFFFFLLSFTTLIISFLGACNTPLERYLQNLFRGMLKTPNFLKFELVKKKKKNCSRSTSANQCGQKNRNGQTIAVLFYNVFY
jgi:hypothetical protein